jgi:speckle-type POZ protein
MEARVFRCMLHFIYTDSLPESDAADKAVMAQHLLVAADWYDLQRLKLICEDMLRSSVDISLAATTLVLAEQHACQELKAACFEFLKAPGNLKAVMASDGFQHLKRSCPSLLEELLAVVAP